MKNNFLTNKQNDILLYIKKYISKYGHSPSVREIANGVNLSSPATVHVHLQNLIDKGFIKRDKTKQKMIELLVPNEFLDEGNSLYRVPLFDKNSTKELSEANNFIKIPNDIFLKNEQLFAFVSSDDAMIKIGIHNKDTLFVQRCNTAKNGDIVVAFVDNNLIIRRFFREKNYIKLQAENDLYTSIVLKKVKIMGIVVGLFRKY